MKKTQSRNLPKIKYVISEPHEDHLQWNLSWALTFDFLVHQEGSGIGTCEDKKSCQFQMEAFSFELTTFFCPRGYVPEHIIKSFYS